MAVEKIPTSLALTIESRATYLERKGREAQTAWFADPTSESKRREFAHYLLDWAKETRNQQARKYAQSLLTSLK